MTDAANLEPYPQYCFHLSPTINRWCHFQIADIVPLTSHPGFQGQDVYFHLNHPIKWVRISGVVVAVDEKETRCIYTVDDSSGATIECVVNVAPRAMPGITATTTDANPAHQLPQIDAPIDVGHILDIKGSLRTFRGTKTIHAEKIVHLRSTEQEVAFWEKVVLLKSEVLSKPWVLDRREVRRCRREEQGRQPTSRHRYHGARHKGQQVDEADAKKARAHHGDLVAHGKLDHKVLARRAAKVTGLEKKRPTKPITRLLPVRGKYDASGL
ncbi:hypothetical protein VTK26DRAFT_5462 [Humicola hyalothermophila]